MTAERAYKVALLWPGDPAARANPRVEATALAGVGKALAEVGIAVEGVVYADEAAGDVHERLRRVDGVLVWVNPIEAGRDRTGLDALLSFVADERVYVSAHPDVIQAIGTKEVLYRTREMGWGCDTRLYPNLDDFRLRFPACIAEGTARVLKQYRGNGGNGVFKVELVGTAPAAAQPLRSEARVRVRHARRGSVEEEMPLGEFVARCACYFEGAGRLIDQVYQPRLTDGMVRCYLAGDRVVGFGEQRVNALFPPPAGGAPAEVPQPGPRLYYPPTRPDFQTLKTKLEREWLPEMCRRLSLEPVQLPVIWDADFLYGPRTATGMDTYVLCEINVSCVYPFPDEALVPLAKATRDRLIAKQR